MTNREWLESLSDSELVHWIKNEFSLSYEDYIDLLVWLGERKETE